MGVETERKFLVNKEKWLLLPKPSGILMRQGYLSIEPECTIRVRMAGQQGFLTIKGKTTGASRNEFEYQIPYKDAKELFENLSVATLSKVRYKMMHRDKLWETDEFLDENEGLIIAEIELRSEEESFDKPDWLEKEVTTDEKYYNSYLATHSYKQWS